MGCDVAAGRYLSEYRGNSMIIGSQPTLALARTAAQCTRRFCTFNHIIRRLAHPVRKPHLKLGDAFFFRRILRQNGHLDWLHRHARKHLRFQRSLKRTRYGFDNTRDTARWLLSISFEYPRWSGPSVAMRTGPRTRLFLHPVPHDHRHDRHETWAQQRNERFARVQPIRVGQRKNLRTAESGKITTPTGLS